MTAIFFILGLIILVKGADFLVNGASGLAKRMGISDLIIGLTIVAFGTSAPELFVNVYASASGNTEIAVGNILGSNICNILLILGICAIIAPLRVKSNTIWKEIPLSLLAAVMVLVVAGDAIFDKEAGGLITGTDGIALLGFFVIFLYYAFDSIKTETAELEIDVVHLPAWKGVLMIAGGLAGLTFGSRWIVDGAVQIAAYAGLSESVTGLTIVAIGTSLPELATSVAATLKKRDDIAIGNVVGSNIFNIFFILGTSAVIKDLPFTGPNLLDGLVTVASSLLLFLFLVPGKLHRLTRWQGIVFVIAYVSYLTWLIAGS